MVGEKTSITIGKRVQKCVLGPIFRTLTAIMKASGVLGTFFFGGGGGLILVARNLPFSVYFIPVSKATGMKNSSPDPR